MTMLPSGVSVPRDPILRRAKHFTTSHYTEVLVRDKHKSGKILLATLLHLKPGHNVQRTDYSTAMDDTDNAPRASPADDDTAKGFGYGDFRSDT